MSWNLLILSDLHMGEQEPGESRARVQQRADILATHLGNFLEYYREYRENHTPWRLVIAGDMIDFMRIHVPKDHTPTIKESQTESSPNSIPAMWKLPPHNLKGTLHKLEQLFTLHQKTFYRLARFLLAGNDLVLLTGNHDAELDWPEVQEMFLQHLYLMAQRDQPSVERETLRARLLFRPRFYYESERIYIEHGHYYDGFCNISESGDTENNQDRRLNSFSHVLNYTQFNKPKAFENLPLHNIDQWSALDILGWYAKRPFAQKLQLFYEFFAMSLRLVMMAWSSSFRRLLQTPQASRKQSMARWASQHNLPVEAIEPLHQFVTPPIHTQLFNTIQALYLDRMFLMVVTSFSMTVFLVAPWSPEVKALLATVTTTVFVTLFQFLAHRRPVSKTIPMLFNASLKIAAYLKTPLIVMAHSHHFEQRELYNGQLYINLGAWTVPEDLMEQEPDTHKPFQEEIRTGTQLPTTPPSCLESIPEFDTTYLMITTSQAPHQFKVCRWSYHHSAPNICSTSTASLKASTTPITNPQLATDGPQLATEKS